MNVTIAMNQAMVIITRGVHCRDGVFIDRILHQINARPAPRQRSSHRDLRSVPHGSRPPSVRHENRVTRGGSVNEMDRRDCSRITVHVRDGNR
ncbi:MAG: hypothetical protein ACXVJT_16330, partial [Thermoanaerobaculia bacterium]